MHRSRQLALLAFVVLASTAGCLDLLTGGTASFEASQATVADDALEETGYELANETTENVTRTFEVAGQERTVEVTNHLVQYRRNASIAGTEVEGGARFALLSTPAVEVAGRTFNPVGDWSERRIVDQLATNYGGLSDVSHVGNHSVTAVGDRRTVETFSGRATVAGGVEINVRVHVAKFRHGDDYVVALGVHPKLLSGERGRVDTLIGGIEH